MFSQKPNSDPGATLPLCLSWNQLPTLHCTCYRIDAWAILGLPSWTHLRTRYWGVFTLQGLKICFVGLAYGVAKAGEKVKHDSTTQRFFL